MNDTLNIEKGTVLYKRSDGSEILFTRTNDEDFYASVRNPNGKVFEEQLLGSILRRGDWEATYEIVDKHGDHDQSSHGSWSTGQSGVSTKTVKTIIERLSETKTPGVTIDIRTGKEAKTGFICSKKGFEKPIKIKDFDADKRKAVLDYIDKNIEELNKEGATFGGWVVKSEDTVYLDVSRKFDTRQDAVRAMFDNEQDAIYDVKNDSYIYRKDEKDDRTNKALYGRSSNTHKGYDQGRERRLYRKNLEGDRREPLNENSEHICLGRFSNVKKHREGDHDQATHGSWAAGRFPENSVSKARNGAKDYAYQKGIKQDDTIDYTKVVANRERASKIADVYESLPKMDRDAIDEYESLSTEVEEQFDFMTKELGIKVEFVKDDPYKTSKEMFDDASNGTLKVLSTASTGAHPLFSDNQNDKFRAVHDYFGHAATGRGFGQDGEEAAWVHHSQMFTDKARGALTTETRGQNSFYNNRGKQFADQKVALLPEEFWKVPVSFAKRYTTIYFDYGLKPVLKHGEHDQSEHGNWARGYTAEEVARIEAMSTVGPSVADILGVLSNKQNFSDSALKLIVENDRDLYTDATKNIDKEVAQRLASLQEEFKNHEYTEQEKNTIRENVQDEMIDNYVESQKETLVELAQAMSDEDSGSGEPDDLIDGLNEVYGLTHTGQNENGETKTVISSIGRAEMFGNDIRFDGDLTDEDGNGIGVIERRFFLKDGTLNVEHGTLIITNPEYKGTGFAKRLIEQSEAWYTAKGFGYIDIKTTVDDGARHWARAGYDWKPQKVSESLDSISQRVASLEDEGIDTFAKGTPARAEFDSLMARATNDYEPYFADESGYQYPAFSSVKNFTNNDFPLPAEFANIGYTQGAKNWAGKELLAGVRVSYVKSLTAEGQKLLEGPIDQDGDGMIYDGTARERPAPSSKKN